MVDFLLYLSLSTRVKDYQRKDAEGFNHLWIFKDPQPSVGIMALKPGTVTVAFRAYTLPQNLVPVTGNMIETVKAELEKNNFAAPVPHSYVHTIAEANKL